MTKFSVTYNRNGATSGATPVDPGSPYFINSSVTVLGQGSLGRIDHVFKGWAVTPDAAVPQYLPDSTFAITENILLFAVWEENIILPDTYHYNEHLISVASVVIGKEVLWDLKY